MNNKQLIYKLIDNKYNDDYISISIDELTNEQLNYMLLLYNALKFNYKKYKHILTQIKIINNHTNFIELDRTLSNICNGIIYNSNIYKYFIVNNNLNNITITGKLIHDYNFKVLCSSLKNNLNLKILNLSENKISDLTPINDILKNNIITEINLSCNYIDNIDILGKYLKNNTSLKKLYLYFNKIINIKNFLEQIQYNKVLKVLDIRNDNLYRIKTEDDPNYLKDINKYLQNNNSLQELYFDNPYYIGNVDNDFKYPYMIGMYIDKYIEYNNYYINYNRLKKYYNLSNIFKTLKHNSSLKKLTIDVLSNEEYYHLCNMMKTNNSINYLYIINIHNNYIHNELSNFNHDFHELFNILKFNNSIQDLYINIKCMNKKEIKSLSEMLKYNISLKKLTLIINKTPYNDLYSIYRSLEFNKYLLELTIIDNMIQNDDINNIFDIYPLYKSLYFNKLIQQLNIYSNKIKNINLIQDILKNNHNIRYINFKDKSLIDDNFYKELNKLSNLNKKFYNDY